MQLGIIGGLLYTGLFVKAEVEVPHIDIPPIEKRDVFYGVSAPQPGIIWAAGSLGKVIRSDDGGRSWRIQETPVRAHLQAISAWDRDHAVAVGNRGAVIVTSDGGLTWTSVEIPRSEVANKLIRVVAQDDGRAWAVGQMGAVLSSDDYGRTWQRRADEQDLAWNDITFKGDAGWVVGEFGRVMRTVDGGATWQDVNTPVESSLMSVAFRDERNGVAVGVSGSLLVTDDGGETWAQADSGTREHLLGVIWDGANWMAVGDKGVLVTGDVGARQWKAGKVADNHLGWHTQILNADDGGYVLAGSSLGWLHDGTLTALGRRS